MNIPSHILDNLPMIYQNAVVQLLSNLNDLRGIQQQRQILEEFSRKYTLIPEILLLWEKFEKDSWDKSLCYVEKLEKSKSFRRRLITHFYIQNSDTFEWCKIDVKRPVFPFYRKLIYFSHSETLKFSFSCENFCHSNVYKLLKEGIQFPHSKLKDLMEMYEQYSTAPLTHKQLNNYESSLELYEKLISAENDDVKWLMYLKKVADEEFVIQNIEWRLGQNPCSVQLWKLYIKFLNETNNLKILDVYHRYCRLFIEDQNCRLLYRREIEKFNGLYFDVTKWFIDLIKIELQFGCITDAIDLCKKAVNIIHFNSKPLFKFILKISKMYFVPDLLDMKEVNEKRLLALKICDHQAKIDQNLFVDFDDTIKSVYDFQLPQNFNLPTFIIQYFISNPTFAAGKKLIKTCKYFLINNNKKIFIWNFQFYGSNVTPPMMYFVDDSLFASTNHYKTGSLNKIWIGNFFKIRGDFGQSCLSTILSKLLFLNNIQYLTIEAEDMKFKEFKALTDSLCIKCVKLMNVTITTENGENATLEDVVERFPNAHTIEWYHIPLNHITLNTTEKLSNLKRNKKLKRVLWNFTNSFDPYFFSLFFKNNAEINSDWCIYIRDENNLQYKNNVAKVLNDTLSSWIPKTSKPNLYFEIRSYLFPDEI